MPRFPMLLTLFAFDAASLGCQKRGLTAKCLTAVEGLKTNLIMHDSGDIADVYAGGLASRFKSVIFSAGGGCRL